MLLILPFLLQHRPSRPSPFEFHGLRDLHSSIQDAERALGPGLAVTGGHPQGARLWRLSKRGDWMVYVDGFGGVKREGDHSYLIDEFRLQHDGPWAARATRAPLIHASRSVEFWTPSRLLLNRAALLRALAPYRLYISGDASDLHVTPSKSLKRPCADITFSKDGRITGVTFSIYE